MLLSSLFNTFSLSYGLAITYHYDCKYSKSCSGCLLWVYWIFSLYYSKISSKKTSLYCFISSFWYWLFLNKWLSNHHGLFTNLYDSKVPMNHRWVTPVPIHSALMIFCYISLHPPWTYSATLLCSVWSCFRIFSNIILKYYHNKLVVILPIIN